MEEERWKKIERRSKKIEEDRRRTKEDRKRKKIEEEPQITTINNIQSIQTPPTCDDLSDFSSTLRSCDCTNWRRVTVAPVGVRMVVLIEPE